MVDYKYMSKKVNWLNVLKCAGVGGFVIGVTAYVATEISTKIAAIIWSIPFTLFPVIIYMWMSKESNHLIGEYGLNSGFACINMIIFCCVIGIVLKYTKYKDDKEYGALYAMGIACLFWLMGTIVLYYLSPYE